MLNNLNQAPSTLGELILQFVDDLQLWGGYTITLVKGDAEIAAFGKSVDSDAAYVLLKDGRRQQWTGCDVARLGDLPTVVKDWSTHEVGEPVGWDFRRIILEQRYPGAYKPGNPHPTFTAAHWLR